jgi:hypothetical protein
VPLVQALAVVLHHLRDLSVEQVAAEVGGEKKRLGATDATSGVGWRVETV